MQEAQIKRLENYKENYLSIGITKDGTACGVIEIPWSHTGSAFNMKTPRVYLTEQDLYDPQVLKMLDRFHIIGCYIFESLKDYSFLANFKELWDIFILKGQNVTDLSFMKDLDEWFMFYIEDAHIQSLDPLFPPHVTRNFLRPFCVGFGGCKVDDITAIERQDLYLSELAVFCPEGTNEKARWEKVRTGTYNYYEYQV